MKTDIKFLPLFLLIFSAAFCRGQNLSGRYEFGNSILNIVVSSDSLKGEHCFVSSNGNRIDCCLEETSLFLSKTSENSYKGILKSCYRDTIHSIEINTIDKELKLIFINDDHEFLEREVKFSR